MGKRKTKSDEELGILIGLAIVGAYAYYKYFPGQSFEQVLQGVDSTIKGLLANLPPFTLPQIPMVPTTPTPTLTTTPTPTPTTTIATLPKTGTGQLKTNPSVPSQGSGSPGNYKIVAAAGDWDTNSKAKQTAQVMEKQGIQAIIGTGDYSYGPSASSWADQILGPKYKSRIKGAQGNHDNDSYLSVFGMSDWNSIYKYSPGLAVVFIDTEGGIAEGELDQLTKAAKQQATHVAYAMHKPYITSSDGHHKASENKWGSTIDKVAKANGVKLVLSGHNHVYEHFMCNGIHYVTTGAAGRKFYSTGCKACGPVKCINNKNGFLKISIGSSLLCQFVENSSGSVTDSFTVS